MRKKRFSLAQLLLAIALTAAAVLGCGLLAVRAWMGEGGRSLVEGLRLVNTLFVGIGRDRGGGRRPGGHGVRPGRPLELLPDG